MDAERLKRWTVAARQIGESMQEIVESVAPAVEHFSDVVLTTAGDILVAETELDLWMRDSLDLNVDLLALFD